MYVNDPVYEDEIEYKEVYVCLVCEWSEFEKMIDDKCVCSGCRKEDDWEDEFNALESKEAIIKLYPIEHEVDGDELYKLSLEK